MRTEDLIESLTRDVKPVARHGVGLRLAGGVAIGGVGSVALVAAMLGVRPDLGFALQSSTLWMKWGYTISLALLAFAATARLARPDSGRFGWLWLLATPVIALASYGAIELAATPRADWKAMWLGESWTSCPWNVLSLSAPIFAGLLWAFRRFAPTRLRAAGAAAGLASGAFAAMIYCIHCPEASAIFVLTWYSLGILLATAIGALLGPRLLRW